MERKTIMTISFKKKGKQYHLKREVVFPDKDNRVGNVIREAMASVGATMKNTTCRVLRYTHDGVRIEAGFIV